MSLAGPFKVYLNCISNSQVVLNDIGLVCRHSTLFKCALALGLLGTLFVLFQPYQVNFDGYHSSSVLPVDIDTELAQGLPKLDWNEACFPHYNTAWVGGTSRSSFDPPGMELPLHIWSAVPSLRKGEEELVIMGPMGSSSGRGAKSPAKNFSRYHFECFFPETKHTSPGRIQKDAHGNVAVIKCQLPANDPLKEGKSTTTVEFRDLTHKGHVTLTACLHPKSKVEYELAAVVVARDIACQLETWLEHLFLLGFDHVFFYDHFNSDEATMKILKRYVAQGLMTVFPWRLSRDKLWGGKFDREQIVLYNDAIYRFQSQWLYVADVDEFPFFGLMMRPPDIPAPQFFNQSLYNPPTNRMGTSQPITAEAQLKILPKPDFQMPKLPQFNISQFSRPFLRKYFLGYLDHLDAKSQFKLGEAGFIRDWKRRTHN